MMNRFWFGKNVPTEYADLLVKDNLSFNGQLHLRCRSCGAFIWGEIIFTKQIFKTGQGFPCPNCRQKELDVVKFVAVESRLCTLCGEQAFASPEVEFECTLCKSRQFTVAEVLINPPYPKCLFALLGRNEPFGRSPKSDLEFLLEYVRALRMSPQFHLNCIHLVAFMESIFEQMYGSTEEAIELLNAASGLMRTVYKETGDLDAAYLSIALMIRGRNLTITPVHHAVYGFNINQNVYSVLARGHGEVMAIRFQFDLKEYGIWLSRQTLGEFDSINEGWLGELRAKQKWLLGDILKAGSPSEAQIDEALQWFDAALKDPALPGGVADYVRESAHVARAKRKNLSPEERRQVQTDLSELAEKHLDQTQGLQRINSLTELLRGATHLGDMRRRKDIALRCLGEALIYTAANDPRNMLRHAGTLLAQLVAGFAAERFDSGKLLEGIAGVEAFRSLAINHGNVSTTLGHHVHELELQLLTGALFGTSKDPVAVAKSMLSQYQESLERNVRDVLELRAGGLILWCEVWDGNIFMAKISLGDTGLVVQIGRCDRPLTDVEKGMNLPMADMPPGRLRARQVETALSSGWEIFKPLLVNEPAERPLVFVGPSILGGWPIDAAEAVQNTQHDLIRPTTFAPTISVASSTHKAGRGRSFSNILILSYGGTDLADTRQEVEYVERIYGSGATVLNGETVSKSEVLAALSGAYDVIHFCGHGDFDYLEPMQSKLYFRADPRSGGFVTADDILSRGSIGRQPVVVLSACTSALVYPNGSNNFLGLAGALLRTGAASIVGTRWPISDMVAAAFSRHFHTRLADGHSVDDAVAFTKKLLKDTRLDEWSAFMSIGG